jgi:uncharacterized membrane protein
MASRDHRSADRTHHEDTARLEAFSDGVFAIAITLLVLEIGVPRIDGKGSLTRDLIDLWPSYFGYVVSFATIGVMWLNHHHMFKDIERCDNTLLALNLVLLLTVSFLPFPTAVLAEYLGEDEFRTEATLAYGATLTVIAMAFNALWLHAARSPRLLDDHVSPARIRSRTRRYLPGPILYGLTLPLALITPWIALSVYAFMAVFFTLPLAQE